MEWVIKMTSFLEEGWNAVGQSERIYDRSWSSVIETDWKFLTDFMVIFTVYILESIIEMVVLRRRQVACIRMGLFTFLIGAGLVFVYHYVDNNDYQKQMEDAIRILERDTGKIFQACQVYLRLF